MNTTKSEVEEFLAEARELITQNRVFLVPREGNVQALVDLNLLEPELWPLLAGLTVNNYCSGPDDDEDGSGTFVWKFGRTMEKKTFYIKLKMEDGRLGRRLKCLSFHLARFPLQFPLRP